MKTSDFIKDKLVNAVGKLISNYCSTICPEHDKKQIYGVCGECWDRMVEAYIKVTK